MTTVHIPKMQCYVTLQCNLRCKLCGTYCAEYENPVEVPTEILVRDVDRFFGLIDSLGRFEVTGGEPLLHPQLPQFLEYLTRYMDRIEYIQFLSNGRVLPSRELCVAISKWGTANKIVVLVDDYGSDLSTNASEAVLLYEGTGAKVEHRAQSAKDMYYGGWVDFGVDASQKRTSEDIAKIPEECAVFKNEMHSLYNGIIYSCGRGIYYYEAFGDLNGHPKQFPDCVDLFAKNKSDDEIRREIEAFWQSECYRPCLHCNGQYSISKRFIPSEQV